MCRRRGQATNRSRNRNLWTKSTWGPNYWKLLYKPVHCSTSLHSLLTPGSGNKIAMRPCLNELQKEYCVKTKVITLDWQWVTLRSWCQMSGNCHSSPVKNKVVGKPHKILEKLKITSEKLTLFGHFFVKYF